VSAPDRITHFSCLSCCCCRWCLAADVLLLCCCSCCCRSCPADAVQPDCRAGVHGAPHASLPPVPAEEVCQGEGRWDVGLWNVGACWAAGMCPRQPRGVQWQQGRTPGDAAAPAATAGPGQHEVHRQQQSMPPAAGWQGHQDDTAAHIIASTQNPVFQCSSCKIACTQVAAMHPHPIPHQHTHTHHCPTPAP
jgi:hypothetical protein